MKNTAFDIFVPYRLCILGEHVDHQNGETLSANIGLGVRFRGETTPTPTIEITARDFGGEETSFRIDGPLQKEGHWSDYPKGIVATLRERMELKGGLRGEIFGEFPSGGISSSAAIQIAYLMALLSREGKRITRREAAEIVVSAERSFVGVNVGWLDPMTILCADGARLLHLDYTDLSRRSIEWPHDRPMPKIAVVFSGIVRKLLDSPYNRRIEECRAAAERLQKGARVFRDVDQKTAADVESLDSPLRERARHYFSEIERVHRGIEFWRSGDLVQLARLVDQCGDSCVDNFALGTPEMIALISALRAAPGVMAARFTGGGFGGSAVVLMDPDAPETLDAVVRGPYAAAYPDCAARAHIAYPAFGRAADPQGLLFSDRP